MVLISHQVQTQNFPDVVTGIHVIRWVLEGVGGGIGGRNCDAKKKGDAFGNSVSGGAWERSVHRITMLVMTLAITHKNTRTYA